MNCSKMKSLRESFSLWVTEGITGSLPRAWELVHKEAADL